MPGEKQGRGSRAQDPMTSRPIRYLVLWLTTACNLRCRYCYRGEQPVRSMPLPVVEAALRLACSSGLPFHVQLAGGEPTLEPELIAAVGKIVRTAGWPSTMGLQTNGTLLDDSLIELCRTYGIAVGLSLDGPPDIQQYLRGKAGETFRGLDLLARHNIPVRVTTVLSAANVAHLGDLILSLAVFPNVQGAGLDPLLRKGSALEAEALGPSVDAIRSGVSKMFTTLARINALRGRSLQWREQNAVAQALAKQGKIQPYCHACSGQSLAVSPDGTVYPCGQAVGDPAMKVGTVDHIDWRKLREMYQGVHLSGDCRNCLLEGRCPGDCPSRLTYNSDAAQHAMCVVYQTILKGLGERMTHERAQHLLLQRDSHGTAFTEPGCVSVSGWRRPGDRDRPDANATL